MSSGPRTVVDANMCGAGAAPKVGYMNGSDGATPLCHVGTFSGACSNSCCHTPIPGPTRMDDLNWVQGVRLYTGTLYLFFFSKLNLYLWVYKQFL